MVKAFWKERKKSLSLMKSLFPIFFLFPIFNTLCMELYIKLKKFHTRTHKKNYIKIKWNYTYYQSLARMLVGLCSAYGPQIYLLKPNYFLSYFKITYNNKSKMTTKTVLDMNAFFINQKSFSPRTILNITLLVINFYVIY